MADLELVTHSIEVPKNTGASGFLHTISELLKLTRIQGINIDSRGKVTYTRYVDAEEREPIKVDYAGVEPYHMIRNAPDGVEELEVACGNAAVILASVLDKATTEKLHPIAFIASPNTVLPKWYQTTTGYHLGTQNFLCGIPMRYDRHVPDTALIMCAAYVREGALVDTQKAYKIEMDYVLAPTTDVRVF